jgi:RNA polymerase sigma factor (sigma-70 family)
MLSDEKRVERKETRRHLSLDMLIEIEEREKNHGSLENKSLKRNQDTFSLISSELDPLEILIRQEHTESKPIVMALSLNLTDYQRKIAVEYYINNKTQTQIAKELGVTRMAVSYIMQKVQKKVVKTLT